MKKIKGVILINSAILIESDMLSLVNNNVICVEMDDDKRFLFLESKRGITKANAEKRISNVMSHKDKMNALKSKIKNDRYGEIFNVKNNEKVIDSVKEVYDKISKELF